MKFSVIRHYASLAIVDGMVVKNRANRASFDIETLGTSLWRLADDENVYVFKNKT